MGLSLSANSFICRYNYVHDTEPEEAGIRVGGEIPAGTVHQVYYNIVVNTGGGTSYPYGIAVGGRTREGSVSINNNTIYTDGAPEHSKHCVWIASGTNVTFKNNILYSGGTSGSVLIVFSPDPSFVSDYNLFYTPNVAINIFEYNNATYHSLSAWRSVSGQDAHSIYGDPSFINNASDWGLKLTSPALNKGTNVGILSDHSGNPIVGLPDIGAFEIQAPIPGYVSSKVENVTPAVLELIYDLTLDEKIVPASSAGSVKNFV